MTWFRTISVILVLFGIYYFFFGFAVFSNVVPLIPHAVLLPWTSALYGAIMAGWGLTLYFVGSVAFRRNDAELKRLLLVGLGAWLILEAAVSAWFGVWFNVGVDVVVFTLFAVPLLREIKRPM